MIAYHEKKGVRWNEQKAQLSLTLPPTVEQLCMGKDDRRVLNEIEIALHEEG